MSEPSWWREPSLPKQSGYDKQWPIVVAVSGGVITLGSLLPWATLTTAFGNVSKNGTDGDGTLTLLAGVVIGIFGFAMRSNATRSLRVIALLAAIGVGVVVGIDFVDVQRVAGESNSDYARISAGVGLYVTGLGAVGAAVGAVASISER